MTTLVTPLERALPGVVVRPLAEFGASEIGFLESAGLGNSFDVEAWTVTGSNHAMGYSTHGIFRFFGKFPPPIARQLITSYSKPGEVVADPMCGSGTAGVEAALTGRRADLSDVNPLSILLSRVKTTYLPIDETEDAISRVLCRAAAAHGARYQPVGLRQPEHWFLPETLESLARLRESIAEEPTGPLQDFLLVCFAAIVRKVSRATTQQGRLFLDVDTAIGDALPVFERQAKKSAIAVGAAGHSGDIRVSQRDLLDVHEVTADTASFSIMHPPYFNMYRYSSVNSLEMAWLGMDIKSVRKLEIREFFKVGKPDNVTRYLEDMTQILENGLSQVRAGGRAALMIGDTTIGGKHIRVTRPLLDSLPAWTTVEKLIVRIPKFTEATWAASQRRTSATLGVRLYDLIAVLRRAE